MQQLTEEENTPKKARILSPAEIAEGAKYAVVAQICKDCLCQR